MSAAAPIALDVGGAGGAPAVAPAPAPAPAAPSANEMRALNNAFNTRQIRNGGNSINDLLGSITGKVQELQRTGQEILNKISRINVTNVSGQTIRDIIDRVENLKVQVRDGIAALGGNVDGIVELFAEIDRALEEKLAAVLAAGGPGAGAAAAALPRLGGPAYEPPSGFGTLPGGGAAPARPGAAGISAADARRFAANRSAAARRAAPAPVQQGASLKEGVTYAEAQAAYDAYMAANAAFEAYAATAVQRRGRAANQTAMVAITQEENRLRTERDTALNRYKAMVNLPGASIFSSGTIVPPQRGGRRSKSKSKSRSKSKSKTKSKTKSKSKSRSNTKSRSRR